MDTTLPPQEQKHQPGKEDEMHPTPESIKSDYKPAKKLAHKVALITGGDSGIGRAVAYAFALEGAKVAIVYLEEMKDAAETERTIKKMGGQCISFKGDVTEDIFCKNVVKETVRQFGQLDILVNNAGEQHVTENFEEMTNHNFEKTFRTNIFAYFYMTKAALPYLHEGASIINTTSVTAYHGNQLLVDYSATKGAIVSFTRSLALNLAKKKIRVNGVAPGPIWTPLIPASFSAEQVKNFGKNTPLGRPGQPSEVSPCYVFLASDDASYMTGQILHPNGGTIVNG